MIGKTCWIETKINMANIIQPPLRINNSTLAAKSWLPNKTNAVYTSVLDVVGTAIVPEMWGAKGDGVTDDTQAIQNAIDYAAAQPYGGEIVLQTKKYLTGSLKIKPKVTLRGANPVVFSETSVANWGVGASLVLKTGVTTPLIYNSPDDADGRYRQAGSDGRSQYYISTALRNLILDANGANESSSVDALRIERIWGMELSDCHFRSAKRGFAWRILDCNTLKIFKNSVIGPIFMESVADSEFSENQIAGSWGTDNLFWSGIWLSGTYCWKNIFTNNFIFNNTSNMGAASWTFTVSGNTITTSSTHYFNDYDPVILTTNGTLPTGFSKSTCYYVKKINDTQFKLGLSRLNVLNATYVSASDSGSGTHTVQGGRNSLVYMERASRNIFNSNRFDQGYGSGILFDNAMYNSFYGGTVQENGLNNSSPVAGIELENSSKGNVITHIVIDGGVGVGNQTIGIKTDSTSTGNTFKPNNIRGHSTTNLQINGVNSELDVAILGSDKFESISGSPAISLIGGNRRNAWAMDATTDEIIGTELYLEPGWGKMRIHIYWTNMGVGTGSAAWACNVGQISVGSTLNVADAGGSNIVATVAGAQDILMKTTLTPDFTTLIEGLPVFIRIKRAGTDASDTLANDAGVVMVQIERVPA